MSDEIKDAIIALMEKNSKKGKKKSYPKDLAKTLSKEHDRKQVKKMILALLDEQKLNYWSSGSTTYVMLPDDFAKVKADEEGS
jgi:Dissimilatory sulfite reductase D (DsrD)